ncbi:MAG: hypothetical protein ACI8PT_004188 [Gammaproteobacteria bacterium]
MLTVIALGVQPGTSGDINDTSRTPGAFQGNETIFLASGDIGAEGNPVTAAAVTLSAGAGSGAEPQFDVPPGGSAPSSSVTLDQARDAIASAFNVSAQFTGNDLFSTLSTNVNVDTSTQTGRKTSLGELGFLDESVFREFTLFALEIGILVPWYADENFPTLPNPDVSVDVDGNLDEDLWVQAVAEFMEAAERKLVDEGLAEPERARIREEVVDYLAKRRLRNTSAVRNFSAQASAPTLRTTAARVAVSGPA